MSKRIFVTGATGYLGGAVASRFVHAGYEVFGLTRSEERAEALEATGVTPVVGDLSDPDTYVGKLKNCDVAVHAAFDPGDGPSRDQQTLEAVRAALVDGRVRRLLYTSGMWVHGGTGGKVIDENAPIDPLEVVKWRAAHEEVAMDYVEGGLESIILRPAIVYGESRGILGAMWREAREKRTVTYPGDGSQHWGMVHRNDVAEAYLLALEHAKAGNRFALVDETRLTVREIAEAIAGVTGAKPQPWPKAQVLRKLGANGEALLTDQQITAAKARRELGWVPRHASFVKEAEGLYAEWQAGQETAVQ